MNAQAACISRLGIKICHPVKIDDPFPHKFSHEQAIMNHPMKTTPPSNTAEGILIAEHESMPTGFLAEPAVNGLAVNRLDAHKKTRERSV